MTQRYVGQLVEGYPSILEVWLFGSRANGGARPNSDWDYMVFSDDAFYQLALHNDRRFNVPEVDLMLVGPGVDEAIKPWPEADGYWKKLGLGTKPGGIGWRVVSDTEAEYTIYRDRRPGSIEKDPQKLKAILVHRRRAI